MLGIFFVSDRLGLLVDIRFIGKHEPVLGLKIKYPQVDLR